MNRCLLRKKQIVQWGRKNNLPGACEKNNLLSTVGKREKIASSDSSFPKRIRSPAVKRTKNSSNSFSKRIIPVHLCQIAGEIVSKIRWP